MIATIRPKSYPRYLSLPILGSYLDDFTQWSHHHGYTHGTIRNQLKDTRQIVIFLQKRALHSIDELTHYDFDKAWRHFSKKRPDTAGTVRRRQKFLDEKGELTPQAPVPKTRTDKELDNFAAYLKNVRGLSATTIQSHLVYLRRFLKQINFNTCEQALSRLTQKQVEKFTAT